MKELIVDRGYIDGDFFSKIKRDHNVDVLVPLKKSMLTYQDAITIAEHEKKWQMIECNNDSAGKEIKKVELAQVNKMDLWDSAQFEQHVVVSKETFWNYKTEQYEKHYFILAGTKKYKDATDAINPL